MYGLGLNCPGDPGCPGYALPDVTGPILSQQEQTQYSLDALWDYYGALPANPPESIAPMGQPQSLTSWLNANAGKVALGVGGVFALVMIAKAGR